MFRLIQRTITGFVILAPLLAACSGALPTATLTPTFEPSHTPTHTLTLPPPSATPTSTATPQPTQTQPPPKSPTPAPSATPLLFLPGHIIAGSYYQSGVDYYLVNPNNGTFAAINLTQGHFPGVLQWCAAGDTTVRTYILTGPDGSGVYEFNPSTQDWALMGALDLGPQAGRTHWSPDCSRLAHIPKNDPTQLQVVNAAGTGVTQLLDLEQFILKAVWSPDGSRLALEVSQSDPNFPTGVQIYVVNADGSNLTQLTHDPVGVFSPVWSPDGTQLLYNQGEHPTSSGMGNVDLYVMQADGTNPHPVAADPHRREENAHWSPDGAHIAFSYSEQDGVYVMGADGSALHSVVSDGVLVNWSPDGVHLLYRVHRGGNTYDLRVVTLGADSVWSWSLGDYVFAAWLP